VLIYTDTISPRLRYIISFFSDCIGIEDFRITSDEEEFLNYSGPRINYSNSKIAEEEIHVVPVALLMETGVREQNITISRWDGLESFFKTNGDLPFDIFAASFYLVTCYEEYLPHQKDMYGRYAHENSIAFREGFLQIPLVNLWFMEFAKLIRQKFPSVQLSQPSFKFLPTYDIDESYAYLHKPGWVNFGGQVKDVIKGNFQNLRLRSKVVKGLGQDPYDAFDWMDQLHAEFALEPIYFFLMAEKRSRYDKNILASETSQQELINRLATKYPIGLHPSWQSGDKTELLEKEKKLLEQIISQPVTSSRQHYIRLTLPQTYRQLISAGMLEDYSMGYGSINGFRASIATPFYWYDLEKEEQTSLKVFPFCFMEANSYYEQQFTSDQALEEMFHYYTQVKEVNGTFITIWHNTFLGTASRFDGWRDIYKTFIKRII